MATNVNWGKLTREGRVKAPGIYWTAEEWKAIQSGIDPEEVRAGNLTKKATEAPANKRELSKMTKPMLVEKAKALKLVFDENVVTRADLIELIQKAENKKAETENE